MKVLPRSPAWPPPVFRSMLAGDYDEESLARTHGDHLKFIRLSGYIYGILDKNGISVCHEFASPFHKWSICGKGEANSSDPPRTVPVDFKTRTDPGRPVPT